MHKECDKHFYSPHAATRVALFDLLTVCVNALISTTTAAATIYYCYRSYYYSYRVFDQVYVCMCVCVCV